MATRAFLRNSEYLVPLARTTTCWETSRAASESTTQNTHPGGSKTLCFTAYLMPWIAVGTNKTNAVASPGE